MAENKINVGGRLHSIATGNVLGGANEIFDDDKNKKQSDINTETYSLVNNINERLNGLSPEQQSALNVATKATNNEVKLGYYVCDTEGNLAAKVISDATGYVLSKGGSMKVKMTNVNTAANATLNINSTGAKALYYAGERASANNSWEAGETVEVYYDGTSYYANSVAGGSGSGDGAFDISAKTGQNYETLSAALTAANSILSASKKKGGMSIKFIQLTPAKYTVVKTEGATEQPTGTEIQSDPGIISGTYTAGELSVFSTLPATLNSSLTYYLAVTETVDEQEVTTYTTWIITYVQSSDNKYVQYRYMKTVITTATFTNVINWQGVDDEPTFGSDNLVKSGGVSKSLLYNRVIGEGNTYSETTIVGLTPNKKYGVILNNNWGISEVTVTGVFAFAVQSYDINNQTTILAKAVIGTTIKDFYEFTVPADSVEIRIGGRANVGSEIRFNIIEYGFLEDRLKEIEDTIDKNNTIPSDIASYKTTQNNNVYSDKHFHTISGHTYLFKVVASGAISGSQLSLKVSNWDDKSTITQIIVNLLVNGAWDGSEKKAAYTADTTEVVAIGSWCSSDLTSDVDINIQIEDITELKYQFKGITVAETISNGTPNNHANTYAVRTSPMMVIEGTYISIYTDKPLTNGNYYGYTKHYKDKDGNVVLNTSLNKEYNIQEVPVGAYTTEIGLAEYDSEGNTVTLRNTDFKEYRIYIVVIDSRTKKNVDILNTTVNSLKTTAEQYDGKVLFDNLNSSYLPIKNTTIIAPISFGLMKGHTYNISVNSNGSFSGTQLSLKLHNIDTAANIRNIFANLLTGGSWNGSLKKTTYTYTGDFIQHVSLGSYANSDLVITGNGTLFVTIEDVTIQKLQDPKAITRILDLNPSPEYLPKIRTIRRSDFNYISPNNVTIPFTFIHFSDIHKDSYNMPRIKEWWDEYSDYIDGVLNTGDNTATKWNEDISFLNNNGGDKIFNVIGNHDVAQPGVSSNYYNGAVPHTDVYAKFMSGLMDDTYLGVIRPANASTNGYCFYYKDFINSGNVTGQNLRLIVSDSVIQDSLWIAKEGNDKSYYEAELAWLEDVLDDALTNNLSVVIASHYSPKIVNQNHDARGFSLVENTMRDERGIHVAFHQKVQDFINAGGKFVCWLCGHRHTDSFGTVDGFPKQMAITVTTASCSDYRNIHYYDVKRAQNDKSADAFNMIGIDTEHKIIRILRIGCNYDGYFRPCENLCVDFSDLNNIKVVV